MRNIEDYIDKLKNIREEVTIKAMGNDLESDLEDLIKLENVDDTLYEMLLLIFTRSKNKLSIIKNDNAKNTLMLIDMQIATLEHLLHNKHHITHPNRLNGYTAPVTQDVDINIVNNTTTPTSTTPNTITNTNSNNDNQTYNWAMVFNANNLFKIGSIIIFMLFAIWTMFSINPKASTDTVKSIVDITQEIKGKDK